MRYEVLSSFGGGDPLLPSAQPHGGADVERINQYAFYELGRILMRVAAYSGEVPASAGFLDLMQAEGKLNQLLQGDPVPIQVSRKPAEALRDAVATMLTPIRPKQPDGKPGFKYPDETTPPFHAWQWNWLRTTLSSFETVFTEEMRQEATYYVPRRGIFHTPSLIDTADEAFPPEIRPYVPEKAKAEWRSAGRCIAFNILSASGFHVARGVEAMMERYWQTFAGKGPDETLKSWNDYLVDLDRIAKAKPTPCPSSKTLAELRQMKDDYRNPIMHPRVVLSESDARILFDNGEAAIILMAEELRGVRQAGGLQLGIAGAFTVAHGGP